jgi:hypothetical protein
MVFINNIVKHAYYDKSFTINNGSWGKPGLGTPKNRMDQAPATNDTSSHGEKDVDGNLQSTSKDCRTPRRTMCTPSNANSLAAKYVVLVSDVGIVHQGESLSKAVREYGMYVLRSVHGVFGFTKKTVTLLEKDVLVMQYAWLE